MCYWETSKMKDLRTIWNELTSKYTNNDELINELWMEIETQYTSGNRHYHNLKHLEYMTDKAVKYKDNLIDFDTVLFSIFYHDIVYNTQRKDNEQKSADIAHERLTRLGVPTDKIERCYNLIIATKDHKGDGSNDTDYLLDFDLAILGDTPENYKTYTRKIREEYSTYSDHFYQKGRRDVIQHFLGMYRIFKTDEFYECCEQRARENLKTEIDTY